MIGSKTHVVVDKVRLHGFAGRSRDYRRRWLRCASTGAWLLATMLCLTDASSAQDLFLPSDANGDGFVDIADSIALLDFLFAGGLPPPCSDLPEVSDSNGDGSVNTADPIYLLTYLYQWRITPGAGHRVRNDQFSM